jgi:DNA polymerase-3 subunit epsilon
VDNLAIVDVETTGMWPQRDRVIEVGIVLINQELVEDQYSQLINPHAFIRVITGITGITSADVEKDAGFRDQAEAIYQRLTGRVLVAHNVRFDYGFLKRI